MSSDIGEAVERAVTLRTTAGQPVNADSVPTWSVVLPDGSPGTAPAVSQTGVGAYRVLYTPPAAAGMYTDAWSAVLDGSPVRFTDTFRVRGTSARPLLSLAEARGVIGVPPDPGRDEELRDLVEAASAVVEDRTGQRWRRMVVTAETHAGDRGTVLLRHLPVTEIIEVRRGTTPLSPSAYQLTAASGVLRLSGAGSLSTAIEVDYVAGAAAAPADVIEAVRLRLRALWRHRSGASGSPRRSTGGENLDTVADAAIAALPQIPGFG